MAECIFCKIAQKKEKADIVAESDKIIVFKDINPKAPIHLLIVPKEHIESVKELLPEHKEIIGEMFLMAKKVAEKYNLSGYKLVINVGREGGQIIDHLHLHLLGGGPTQLP